MHSPASPPHARLWVTCQMVCQPAVGTSHYIRTLTAPRSVTATVTLLIQSWRSTKLCTALNIIVYQRIVHHWRSYPTEINIYYDINVIIPIFFYGNRFSFTSCPFSLHLPLMSLYQYHPTIKFIMHKWKYKWKLKCLCVSNSSVSTWQFTQRFLSERTIKWRSVRGLLKRWSPAL